MGKELIQRFGGRILAGEQLVVGDHVVLVKAQDQKPHAAAALGHPEGRHVVIEGVGGVIGGVFAVVGLVGGEQFVVNGLDLRFVRLRVSHKQLCKRRAASAFELRLEKIRDSKAVFLHVALRLALGFVLGKAHISVVAQVFLIDEGVVLLRFLVEGLLVLLGDKLYALLRQIKIDQTVHRKVAGDLHLQGDLLLRGGGEIHPGRLGQLTVEGHLLLEGLVDLVKAHLTYVEDGDDAGILVGRKAVFQDLVFPAQGVDVILRQGPGAKRQDQRKQKYERAFYAVHKNVLS